MIKKIFLFLAISLILSSCSKDFKPHVLTLNTYHIYCDFLALDSIYELLPKEDLFLLKSKADKPGRSNYIYLKNLEYTEQSIIKLISNKTTYTLKQRP